MMTHIDCIFNWIILYEQVEEAELDEMWSFVQNKSNQRWLWLAIISQHKSGFGIYFWGT